jgi:peptide/nickel transport system permease protein
MAVCFVVIGCLALLVVFGPLAVPAGADSMNLSETLARPSGAHLLGTDALGRDVLARLILGARSALVGPLLIAFGSFVCGNVLGLVAGYRGGWVDSLIMRWVDLMWSVPSLLLLIVVSGIFQGGYWLAVAMLIVLSAPFDARVVRGAVIEQMTRPYVPSAKTLGVSDPRVMFLHVWPNVSGAAAANTFLVFTAALVGLSGLSFLGLGVRPGTPDWGLMVAEARPLLFANPVAALAPAAMIVVAATCMSLLGDWLHEQLSSAGVSR